MDPHIRFVSLGMVVLDELRLPNGEILHDCVGGSGAYSTLGARIVTDPAKANEVGSFILAGHDFPKTISELIRSWNITLELDVDQTRKSTRGLLEYHDEAFGRESLASANAPMVPPSEWC
jgi:hypothetical protein